MVGATVSDFYQLVYQLVSFSQLVPGYRTGDGIFYQLVDHLVKPIEQSKKANWKAQLIYGLGHLAKVGASTIESFYINYVLNKS